MATIFGLSRNYGCRLKPKREITTEAYYAIILIVTYSLELASSDYLFSPCLILIKTFDVLRTKSEAAANEDFESKLKNYSKV